MSDSDFVYLGCYTSEAGGNGEGIAVARRDRGTGELTAVGLAAATPSPSFLSRHPRLPVIYAANELAEGRISAWAVALDGSLRLLGEQPTGGDHPCHLAVSPDGQYLLTANYGSGSVSVHPLDPLGVPGERTDLRIHQGGGPHPERQEGPHAHMVALEPDSDRLWVVDLGVDAVYPYRLDATRGTLVPDRPPVRVPPGTGPRHLARSPDGRLRYLVGELDGSVASYDTDPVTGSLRERQRSATTTAAGHSQPAGVAVRRDGEFLYLTNRGPDTLAVFALIDGDPRYVAEVSSGGKWPRHFAMVDDHLYVANERSHVVVTFRIPAVGGLPEPEGKPLPQGSPTCVLPFLTNL